MNQQKLQALRKRGQVTHPSQIQQAEQYSIQRIQQLSTDISIITDAIDAHQAEIDTHPASPIKPQKESSSSQSQHPILQLPIKPKKDPIRIESSRKGSSTSVHFNNYMKSTRTVKEKVKSSLEEERNAREEEQRRARQKVEKGKKVSGRHFRHVQPKYKEYQQRKMYKQRAINARLQQKRAQQMQGATFSPQTNNNQHISQPFQLRLIQQQHLKQQRNAGVISEVLKEQTHKPKLNPNNTSQSRIKQIWQKTPSPVKGSRVTSESHLPHSSSPISKIVSPCDFDFMLGGGVQEQKLFTD